MLDLVRAGRPYSFLRRNLSPQLQDDEAAN